MKGKGTIRKRIICLVMALSLMLAMLYIPSDWLDISIKAGSAEAVQGCGGNHSGMTKWTSTEALPTDAKSYYLANNVTLKPKFGSGVQTIKIEKNTTLCLNGKTITIEINNSPLTTEKIFNILGTLTICDCTGNGQICINASGALPDKDFVLFNINNGCTMNLCGGKIIFNQSIGSNFYSCVSIAAGGSFNMYEGSISGFKVKNGTISNSGAFTMNGGEIKENTCSNNGGGVYVKGGGTFTMNGGLISNNEANHATEDGSGGGVYVAAGGIFTMSGGTIAENLGVDGGGVYVDSGTFNMTEGEITGNTALNESGGGSGGGVYNNNSSCTISGGSITGNKAKTNGGGIYHNSSVDKGTLLKGDVDISGNTTTGGEASNVYVKQNTITVESGFSTASAIGISSDKTPKCTEPVAIISASDDVSDNFKPEYSDTTLYLEYYSDDGVIKVEKPHTEETIPAVAATCTKEGKTEGKKCSVCNAVLQTQETVDALGHTEEAIPAVAATCTAAGKTAGKKCSVCGAITVAQTDIPATGHKFATDWTKNAGYHWHAATCGHTSEVSGRAAHTWNAGTITTQPTCTAKGVRTYTCTVCSQTKTEEIVAKGHSWNAGSITTQPTCTATGVKTFKCTRCNGTKTESVSINPDAHSWDTGSVTKQPTCTATGTRKFTCSNCNATRNETISLIPHTEEVIPAVAPTCTATGLAAGKKCSVCGTILTAQTTVDALGHNWNAGVVTKGPNCTEKGVKRRECSRCGETNDVEVPANGHTEVIIPAVASTCTDTGLTAGKKCSVCGVVTEAQQEVEALGHTEEIVPAVAATCTATGLTAGKKCSVCQAILQAQSETAIIAHPWSGTYTHNASNHWQVCTVCGAENTREGHNWDGGTVTTAATEYAEGVMLYTCTVCRETKTGVIAKLDHTHKWKTEWSSDEYYHWHICKECQVHDSDTAHNWGTGTVTEQPSCTKTGIRSFTCSGCGKTKTVIEPLTPHTEEVIPAVAATCTATGKTEGKKCSVCNAILTAQATVDALGHTWNAGVVTTRPTEGTPGIKTFTCTVCGAAKTEQISMGKITTEVKPEENVPKTEIKTSENELIKAALEETEQESVKNGTDIKIILTVDDASKTVPKEDKQKVETEISGISRCKLGQYLDVNLMKIIDGSQEKILETKALIKVTFEIPINLRNKKEYSVIRVHDGVTKVLKDLDRDPNTVTIETDKFSTYALVYVEKTSSSGGSSSGGGSHYVPSTSRPSESDTTSSGDPMESDTSTSSSKPTESDTSMSSSNPAESDTSTSSGKPTESDTSTSSGKLTESDTSMSSSNPTDSDTSTSSSNPTDSDTTTSLDDNHSVPDESNTSSIDIDNPATGIAISLIPLTFALAALTMVTIKRKKK